MTTPSRLFMPLKVGRCDVKHRCIMSPMSRLCADDSGIPLPSVKEYYAQRACVAGTLLITEATVISPQSQGCANTPGIWTPAQIRAWKEVVDTVHSRESYIWLQLWATGRLVDNTQELTAKGFDLVSSSPVRIPPGTGRSDRSTTPRALTEMEIEIYIEEYVEAAKNAITLAGFDGVEVHGANGHLIDQFSQSSCNNRTDKWGGSIENRSRFGLEVTKRIIAAVGTDRVGFKLSPWNTSYGMGTMEDLVPQFEYMISKLNDMGIAYLHLAQLCLEEEDTVRPDIPPGSFVRNWGNTNPLLLAGGYDFGSARQVLDVTFSNYEKAALAFGRLFVSNPDLPFRLKYEIPPQPINHSTLYAARDGRGYLDYPFSKEFIASRKEVILLFGGRGKTTTPIATLLQASGHPFLVASRSASAHSPYKQVKFDWLKRKTYENPWIVSKEEGMNKISSVWLVAPPVIELAAPVIEFIDLARSRGATRFVLLSASIIELGGPAMGKIHKYLASIEGVEYAVLRPTWFMDNFSFPQEHQCLAIMNKNKVYSAAGNGKIPFIAATDIARVAFHFLTTEKLPNADYILLGPELLTYDEVAAHLTSVLGREIVHDRLTEVDLIRHLEANGVSLEDAEFLATLDLLVKDGSESIMNNVVEEITGMVPQTFLEFTIAEKHSWV